MKKLEASLQRCRDKNKALRVWKEDALRVHGQRALELSDAQCQVAQMAQSVTDAQREQARGMNTVRDLQALCRGRMMKATEKGYYCGVVISPGQFFMLHPDHTQGLWMREPTAEEAVAASTTFRDLVESLVRRALDAMSRVKVSVSL